MVVGALISYFSPSNRGFLRIKGSDDVNLESFPIHDDPLGGRNNPQKAQQMGTARRRKPLRAMAVLTSIAADFDLLSDWCFLRHSLREDRQYREENQADLIPKHLLVFVLISCIFGTFMYLVIATEGRIIAPLMSRLKVDKMSMGLILFISVLVEDLPQIILTFLIEDYYEEEGFLSEVAVFNLMASLYDTAIKLAESFDMRHDVVETGVWCKKSINAHESIVTDVLIVPDDIEMPISQSQSERLVLTPELVKMSASRSLLASFSERRKSTSEIVTRTVSQQSSSRIDGTSASVSSLPVPTRRASQTQLLVDAFFPEEEAVAPQLHFLTTSMDRTGKLWNVESMASTTLSSESHKKQCIRTFKDAESDGFTCLAWVGLRNPNAAKKEKSRVNYFLTGGNNGNTKLWDLTGLCHRSYRWDEDSNNRVASIAAACINGRHTFICGHESGVIRIWQTWIGNCLGQIRGHTKRVTAIKFVDDSTQFISASVDGTLKLWDSSLNFQKRQQDLPDIEVQVAPSKGEPAASFSQDSSMPSKCLVMHDNEEVAVKRFLGHSGAVLSLAVVDTKSVILSGSQDGTARLWSIESGLCLRVFRGHTGGVHSVLAIDTVTFLTGSSDATIKAWDALSGQCLRTYEGHKKAVTGLSLGPVSKDATENATTFISSSADKSVKCWVLTTVSYRDPAATLDHILEIQENACAGRCFDTSSYGYGHQGAGNLLRACSPEQCEFDHPYYYA